MQHPNKPLRHVGRDSLCFTCQCGLRCIPPCPLPGSYPTQLITSCPNSTAAPEEMEESGLFPHMLGWDPALPPEHHEAGKGLGSSSWSLVRHNSFMGFWEATCHDEQEGRHFFVFKMPMANSARRYGHPMYLLISLFYHGGDTWEYFTKKLI